MEFKFKVSTEEIKIVEELLKVGNICLSDFEKSRILGEIFSKKISAANLGGLTCNYGVIKVITNVVVNVEGTKAVKQTDKKTGKILVEELPTTEEVMIQIVPVQFENFMLDGNIVTFIMKVNKEEWNDAVITARVPEKTIKNINNPKISIEYPINDIKTETYWDEMFQKAESKISAKPSRNTLIVWTFDVLKLKGKFPIYGRDVLDVRKIYYYCMENFPKFAIVPLEYRLEYLNEGIELARRDAISSDRLLGPHILAKNITRVLMISNMHSTYGKNKICKTYYKGGSSNKMENIRFISYIKPDGRNTSFSPFAIWHEMAGSYNDEESVSDDC